MALPIKGQEVSATATPQRIQLDQRAGETRLSLINDGTGSVFFRCSATGSSAAFAGTAAELKLLGSEVKAGEAVEIAPEATTVDLACATGVTATVRLLPGGAYHSKSEVDIATADVEAIVDGIAGATPKTLAELYTAQAAGNASLSALAGSGLTITRPSIAQAAAGTTALVTGVAGKVARVHSLAFAAGAVAGTWQLQDSDGTALTGAIPITANGGVDIDRGIMAASALVATAAGKGLQLVTSGAVVQGVATVSVEA